MMLKTALALLLLVSPAMACETTINPHINAGEKVVGFKMMTAPLKGITGIPDDWNLTVKTQEEATIGLIAGDAAAFVEDITIVITTTNCANIAGAIAVIPPNVDVTSENVVVRELTSDDYKTDE